MTNKDLIKQIVQGILDFKIIPFFGAGMSIPFGFKSWDELICEMRIELNSPSVDNLIIAQEYENKFGRSGLIDKLKSCYSISDISNFPTDNHQLILAMSPPIIYTTNYDEAIEKTADLVQRKYYKIASLREIVSMPHGANIIVKFHGDFTAEHEIVLTKEDYDKRMEAENAMDILFRSHLLGKSFFFMGYGLRDKNIDFIFSKHISQYGNENLPTSYIVVFKDQATNERQRAFKEKNIETIVLNSPEELHQILKEINQEVYNGSSERQLNSMIYGKVQQEILLKNDLLLLQKFISSDQYTDLQKAEKMEETLSMKLIPTSLQSHVSDILIQIVSDESFQTDAMDIILRTINWSELDPKLNLDLGVALVALTERKEYHRTFEIFRAMQPLLTLQHIYPNKYTVACIFLYLRYSYDCKKSLSKDQLEDLIYTLRACKYQDLHIGDNINAQAVEEVLDYFIKKYPGWKPYTGISNPTSFNDIRESIMAQCPDDFENML